MGSVERLDTAHVLSNSYHAAASRAAPRRVASDALCFEQRTCPCRTAGAQSWTGRSPAAPRALSTEWLWALGVTSWPSETGVGPKCTLPEWMRLPALLVGCRVFTLAFCRPHGIPPVWGMGSCWQWQHPFHSVPACQVTCNMPLPSTADTPPSSQTQPSDQCCDETWPLLSELTRPSRMTCGHVSSAEMQLCLAAHRRTAYQAQQCDLLSLGPSQ